MSDSRKKLNESSGNTASVLLTKQHEHLSDGHRVKVVIVGCGYSGVASGIAVLLKVCHFNFHVRKIKFNKSLLII